MLRIDNVIKVACMLLFATILTGNLAKAEDSQVLDNKDVPSAILVAFDKAYPDAEIASVEMEDIDGTAYYEVEIKADKVDRDIVFLQDGTLFSVEEEITVKELPTAVVDALKKAHPKGEVDEAEKITRGSEIEYEVVV